MVRAFHILLITFLVVAMSSCKKQENFAPTLDLFGAEEMIHPFGLTFVDPWAKAWDEEDGDLSPSISVQGFVNGNEVGDYILIYTVSDADGISTSVSRSVKVVYQADNFSAYFDAYDLCDGGFSISYIGEGYAGSNPLILEMKNFANLSESVLVKMNLAGDYNQELIIDENNRGVDILGSGTIWNKDSITVDYSLTDTTGTVLNCSTAFIRR